MVDVFDTKQMKQDVLNEAVRVDYNSEIRLTTEGESNELPLRKVTLYKNDVAFYTRYGNIDDNHEIELSFPNDQADRVVKTLKLKDYGDGSVTVQYRTDETDMQGNFFERVGVGNYDQILNTLRGIAVLVSTTEETYEGICVGTSPIQLLGEKETSVNSVTVCHVLTANNELKGIRVCDITTLQIRDDKVAKDFSYFIRGVPQTKQTKRRKLRSLARVLARGAWKPPTLDRDFNGQHNIGSFSPIKWILTLASTSGYFFLMNTSGFHSLQMTMKS